MHGGSGKLELLPNATREAQLKVAATCQRHQFYADALNVFLGR